MKKIIALLLVLAMALSLAACNNGSTTETQPQAGNNESQAANAEPEAITLKVWAPQEDQVDANSWLIQIENKFQEAHPEYKIT